MSVLDTPENVPVPLGFCPCLGKPHPDGDIVYLTPQLSASSGQRAKNLIAEAMTGTRSSEEVQELLTDMWLRTCVVAWTFLDDEGDPIPVTPNNVVRALPYARGGREVADKADDLFADSVIVPLLAKLETLSPTGSRKQSRQATSQKRRSTTKRPRRSLTATTAKAPPPA